MRKPSDVKPDVAGGRDRDRCQASIRTRGARWGSFRAGAAISPSGSRSDEVGCGTKHHSQSPEQSDPIVDLVQSPVPWNSVPEVSYLVRSRLSAYAACTVALGVPSA
jgi:hypothetical protein